MLNQINNLCVSIKSNQILKRLVGWESKKMIPSNKLLADAYLIH